jgi:uncharacterized membrane protein YgcG
MGARFQQSFYTEKNTAIGVTIDDSSFSGSSQGFSVTGITISWRGDDGLERFSPIIGSECKIGLIVDTASLETFIEDLIIAPEGRFTVTVATNDGFSAITRWVGYITTDLTTIEDVPLEIGYVATLTCVDGLGFLKGVQYATALNNPYSGKETIVEHVLRCINKLSFISLYYGTSTLNVLRTVCNWHEPTWTYSSSKDPLANTRVAHTAFYHVDNKGNNKIKTCYEVLEAICRAWGARIVFSGDCFWLVQVNELRSPTSKTVFAYKSDGSATTETGQDLRLENNQNTPGSTDVLRFGGGAFQFFAPLEMYTVDYNHIQSRNLLAGKTFVNGSPVSVTSEDDVDGAIGTVKLNYSGNMRVTANWLALTFQNYFIQFRIQVQVGGYFLSGGISGSSPDWTTSNTDYYYVLSPVISVEDVEEVFSVTFLTPPIPSAAIGPVTFKPAIYKAFTMSGTELVIDPTLGDVGIAWELFSNYLEVLEDGTFDDQSDILRYSTSNNAQASKLADVRTLIGDGPNSVTPGHLEIYNNNTSEWVLSDGWRVGGTGTAKPFSQLLANEVMRGQLTPVKRLTGFAYENKNAPYTPVQPHRTIYWDGADYAFQSGTWDLKTDIFSGDWFKLQTSTAYTENAVQYLPEGSDQGVPTTAGSGSSGSSGGGGTSTGSGGSSTPAVQSLNVFSQEFINKTGNTLTITANGGALPLNEAQIKVYQNGQKLLQSQWEVSGSVITIDATTHYDGSNYEVEFLVIQ